MFLILKESVISIDDNNTNLTGPYVTAFLTGLTAKGVADIKFFDIKHAGEPFPVGLKTISQFIDSRFDKECDSICFDRFLKFIVPYRTKYEKTDLAGFKEKIIEMLSSHPAIEKVAIFTTSILTNTTSTKEILDAIFRMFGKRTLNTINNNIKAEP